MQTRRLEYTTDPNKFDLRTHVWDNSGNLVRKNLYTNHCIDGVSFFERPINSGNLWFENNQPAGRVEYVAGADGKTQKKIVRDAAHIEYAPPLDGQEKMHFELEAAKRRIAELELAAISKEQEQKAAPKAKTEATEAKSAAAPSLRKG